MVIQLLIDWGIEFRNYNLLDIIMADIIVAIWLLESLYLLYCSIRKIRLDVPTLFYERFGLAVASLSKLIILLSIFIIDDRIFRIPGPVSAGLKPLVLFVSIGLIIALFGAKRTSMKK